MIPLTSDDICELSQLLEQATGIISAESHRRRMATLKRADEFACAEEDLYARLTQLSQLLTGSHLSDTIADLTKAIEDNR